MDLNLLLVLDALLEENSVQGAADRLHLSAPAVSRTLSRIRRATGDDILVRTGRTMTPTPHALALRDETHQLVARAQAVLSPSRQLDLTTLSRVFTIRGHDALTSALGPQLIAAVADAAPHVALRIHGEAAGDNRELLRGQVDLDVGSTEPAAPEISSDLVGADRLVVALRPGHPLGRRPLSSESYSGALHVTVSRRGRLRDAVDDVLAAQGLRRRVVAALPTSAAALELVARTDCLTVVAEQLCRPTWSGHGLLVQPLPFPTPPTPVVLAWHRRYDTDPAHAWLRHQVRQALQALLP